MDIARPDIKRKKQRQMILWIGVGVVVLAGAAFAVSRLKPAAPVVDASAVWPDTVKRGDLIRQVRGSTGTLVPREDSIQLIPALTDATVVRIRVLPGAKVTPDTVIMDLSDPQLDQQLLNAKLQQQQAEHDYKALEATLQSTLMDKKIAAEEVNANYTQDQLQAQTDKRLYELGVMAGIAYNKSQSTADQLTAQHKLSLQQLEVNENAIKVQLASSQSKIDQAKSLVGLYEQQKAALEVRAGIAGEAAALTTPMSVGMHVTAGTPVAEVIQLDKLKAALQIAETQAHDIQLGQPATVDTHNGVVQGHVSRIDPTVLNGTRTVDVQLDGQLPPGAVPNLSVDGTINLETLHDVLYVGRPALGNENSTLSLFKEDPDHKGATRVQVKVGKASVQFIQVMEGLREGDTVILSDMSRYDNVDRIRLE
ncbi:MAG TPA: HlyD family efflux transporter periplasmic adaptor subunit [Terracidiphilus sp.]|jgi:multidrug resistance efflux pump|nr:HlyD family efflux transporter periplasmic adaptor subunit [Terracidiphilus sp.]